ncbi:MAG TPA: BamA/TamA family outer membrane protein, partial [Chitinophagaceae bacterium]
WAVATRVPLIVISNFEGGLTPVRQGGGMESKSLRLADKSGKEYVLRSVEKTPDKLLPENLQGTFAVDWIGDEFSGQHPYSALIVPPLAEAAKVPHTNPIIGIVADDPALGEYRKTFAGMLCLIEEREPAGASDNTFKMERELVKDHNNHLDADLFLRARLLDLLMGDWDRHEDQWRWAPVKERGQKTYKAVPRDRDQVFHVTEGLFPSLAALPWLDPTLENFDGKIPHVKYSLFKTRFLKMYPDVQMTHEHWMQVTRDFVRAETDEVLEAALLRLPKESYLMRHDVLLSKLKSRREHIPAAMDEYYRFINRIVDLRTTDKNEKIVITGDGDQKLHILIDKTNSIGQSTGVLWDNSYSPDVTKEIRLYLQGGNDKVIIQDNNSPIRLRIVDSSGLKSIDVGHTTRKIDIYGQSDSLEIAGDAGRVRLHLSGDSLNKKFVPVNLYNVWMPLATGTINADDGFLLGLGFKYTGYDGFRKSPYRMSQEVMLTHSFATDAFRVKYRGEWIQTLWNADITVQGLVQAPDNTMNFFGRGNETPLDKSGDYHRFYRARFNSYQFDPALRWQAGRGTSFSAGPSFQYYHFDANGNMDRLIADPSAIHSNDSTTVANDKLHAGVSLTYAGNFRDNNLLPTEGFYFNVQLQAFKGLNKYSRDFIQLRPEFTIYQKLDRKGSLVFSDRIGGGISIGSPAFYQSMFLGGQGNLLGHLQNRYAGQHMAYNNLQGRLRLANIAGYILPGQLGVTGFYDIGRVWISNEHSNTWHQGTGGGLYFSPASLTVFQVLAGHSSEGWYPYISLNFRL